jgi:hypothetical protein
MRSSEADVTVARREAHGDAYNSSTDSSRRGSTDGPSRRRSTGRRLEQQHWRRFRAAALTAPREEEARATVSSSSTDGSSRRRSTGDGPSSSTDGSPARLGSARLGSARLGSARLGSARLGPARLGSARLGGVLASGRKQPDWVGGESPLLTWYTIPSNGYY